MQRSIQSVQLLSNVQLFNNFRTIVSFEFLDVFLPEMLVRKCLRNTASFPCQNVAFGSICNKFKSFCLIKNS